LYIDFDPSDEDNSLGKYLKSIREEKETSIDDLAEKTRIKKEYLIAIEADKYDDLPQGPYLSLFLKSYSEALEIDYDDICNHLEQAQLAAGKTFKARIAGTVSQDDMRGSASKTRELKPVVDMITRPSIPPREKSSAGDTRNYLMIIGTFVFVAFITMILIIIFTAKPNDAEHPGDSQQIMPDTQQAISPDHEMELRNFYQQFDSLTISIYPETQQAISVIADGIITTKLVNPAEIWTVTAADSISMSCERIDLTRYYINGYRMIAGEKNLAENHPVTFLRDNWLEIVDTSDTEYGN